MPRTIAKHMDDCIACGMCVEICPAVFAEGEEKPVIAHPQVGPESEDCAQQAIDSCPVSCIYWV